MCIILCCFSFINLYDTNLTKVVFILMDFAVRLMVTLAPVNNHFIDLIKV